MTILKCQKCVEINEEKCNKYEKNMKGLKFWLKVIKLKTYEKYSAFSQK